MGLGRNESQGRETSDKRDDPELVGCRSGQLDDPKQHVGGGRQREESADDRTDRVQSVPELRDNAEVPAPASDGPEQVGVVVLAGGHNSAVGGHHLGAFERIQRESELPTQPANASSERDPAHAHVGAVAKRHHQILPAARRREPACRHTCADPGHLVSSVDVDVIQSGEVDQQPTLGAPVTGDAVTSSPDCDLVSSDPRELQGPRNIGRLSHSDDERRVLIVEAVVDASQVVVDVIAGHHDVADRRAAWERLHRSRGR